MRIRLPILVIALLTGLLAFSADAVAGRRVRTAPGKKAAEKAAPAKSRSKTKCRLKAFSLFTTTPPTTAC